MPEWHARTPFAQSGVFRHYDCLRLLKRALTKKACCMVPRMPTQLHEIDVRTYFVLLTLQIKEQVFLQKYILFVLPLKGRQPYCLRLVWHKPSLVKVAHQLRGDLVKQAIVVCSRLLYKTIHA